MCVIYENIKDIYKIYAYIIYVIHLVCIHLCIYNNIYMKVPLCEKPLLDVLDKIIIHDKTFLFLGGV